MAAPLPAEFFPDPFLLPTCPCGGPVALSHQTPSSREADKELRTYRCSACGSEQVVTVPRRKRPDSKQD